MEHSLLSRSKNHTPSSKNITQKVGGSHHANSGTIFNAHSSHDISDNLFKQYAA